MVKSVFEYAVQDTESPDWADGLPALRAGALVRLWGRARRELRRVACPPDKQQAPPSNRTTLAPRPQSLPAANRLTRPLGAFRVLDGSSSPFCIDLALNITFD